jgi:release factor glutamine methyltransferase
MDHRPGDSRTARFESLLARREERVPVAYLTGSREFWSLEFEVNEDVLIPRPETEHSVEQALRLLRGAGEEPLVVADIGTGAGPIAVSLARELPGAKIHATDISERALSVARRNARRHQVEERIRFHRGDMLEPLLEAGLSSPGRQARS